MFETLVHGSERASRRAVFLTASAGVHCALVVAVVAAGMWRIDKLTAEKQPLFVHALVQPIIPPEPEPQQPTPEKPKTAQSPALAQPQAAAPAETRPLVDPADVIVDETTPVHATSSGMAVPAGPGGDGSRLGSGLRCADAPCMPAVALHTLPPPPPPPAEPPVVSEELLEGARVAGNPQIHPPDAVRLAMARDGVSGLSAVIAMCLDASGRVSSLAVHRSTGYREYDARFLAAMRTWRYRPYRQGGRAIPVCSHIHFRYEMR